MTDRYTKAVLTLIATARRRHANCSCDGHDHDDRTRHSRPEEP